jgi:membrane protein
MKEGERGWTSCGRWPSAACAATVTGRVLRGWGSPRSVATAAVRVLVEDQLVDRAAALTYFGLLAIFPTMIVLVAVLGMSLRPDRVADVVVGMMADLLPAGAEDVGHVLRAALQARAQAGGLVGVGLVTSIWAVSGFVAAFGRAASAIRGIPDARPPWRAKLARLPLTLLLLAMLALITVVVLATGPFGTVLERLVGLPDVVGRMWRLARWPVLVVVLNLFFALLQHRTAAPRRLSGLPWARPWVSWGGLTGSALWLAGSAVMSWYITYIAADVAYGALGTVVVFLGWAWLGSFAMLIGVEVDVRLVERGRCAAPRSNPWVSPR